MRITIVGHGPSMKGVELGKVIDATDGYVVRLSPRSWQEPLDYGVRTDYVCTPVEARRLQQVCMESKPRYETWLYIHRGILRERMKKQVEELRRKGFNPVECFRETRRWLRRYKELCKEYRENNKGKNGYEQSLSHFSKGMATIIIAVQRLQAKELLLVGFDNMLLGTTDGFFSFACLYLSDGKISRCHVEHNYTVERQLLDEVIAEYKIRLLRDY